MIIEILIGIGIPLIAAVIFIIRYFWQKEKCFALLQQRVKNQDESIKSEKKDHDDIFKRLNGIDKNVAKIMYKLEIDE